MLSGSDQRQRGIRRERFTVADIDAFIIDRHRHCGDLRNGQCPAARKVAGILDPCLAAFGLENAQDNAERSREACRDEDLRGLGFEPSRQGQVRGNLPPEFMLTARVWIGRRRFDFVADRTGA
ncbi:hypothetical protein D9M70_553840 [compost metagenome]